MARPRTLNDPIIVKTIVDEYKKTPKPTLSGLARTLGIHPDTLYRNIDREDDIGDMLMDAYLYFVQIHEEGLFNKACVGHIFALKCLKKHITFKENKEEEQPNSKVHFTYEIVSKESNATIPTSS